MARKPFLIELTRLNQVGLIEPSRFESIWLQKWLSGQFLSCLNLNWVQIGPKMATNFWTYSYCALCFSSAKKALTVFIAEAAHKMWLTKIATRELQRSRNLFRQILVSFWRSYLAPGVKIADTYLVRYRGRLLPAGLGFGMLIKLGKVRLG